MLFASILTLYFVFPTKDFYWDGVGFALAIQHPGWFGMIEANHPIYIGFASVVSSLVRTIAPAAPVLRTLQGLNSVLGAICVVVIYEIARELFVDEVQALLLAAIFALSATWWKFATDSNAYIPALLLLVIAARMLLPGRKAKPLRVALLHTFAMLFHELAVIFFLPAAVGIYCQHRDDRQTAVRNVAIYLATAFGLTSAAYYTCFYLSTGRVELSGYLRWIASHTPDSGFSFAVGRNLWFTIRGTLRLAGGGAVGLFHSGPVNVALTLALVGLGTVLVWRTGPAPVREPVQRSAALFLSSWIAAYAAFLFFWMPQNTFYRLFYLPPLVLLCGTALKRCGGRRAMCVVVGLFGAWNVLFYIHPHSLAETNTVLRGALAMQSIWKPGTWVYVGSFNADDWTVFCFNPQVMFKGLDRARLAEAAVELKSMENSGHETWIDHSAIESLRSDHVGERWLTDHTRAGFARDFSDSKHGVRFLRLFP